MCVALLVCLGVLSLVCVELCCYFVMWVVCVRFIGIGLVNVLFMLSL